MARQPALMPITAKLLQLPFLVMRLRLSSVRLTAAERFDVLKSGEIDVMFRNTTWTQSRDSDVGLDFGPVTYFDGQQLMGPGDKFNTESGPSDVDGAILCTNCRYHDGEEHC